MTEIGLLFGSFNPIHIGHLAMANYLLEFVPFDELWFIVSPQNPFKEHSDLASADQRLKMAQISIRQEKRFKVSNIEFEMPVPSYTIHTLNKLSDDYPNNCFSMIIGSDNLINIKRWHESEKILQKTPIVVYPRPGYSTNDVDKDILNSVKIMKAPFLDISSTLIREGIGEGKKLRYLVPEGVYDYILDNQLY